MMRFRDVTILAATKLRTRRIRTSITVVVSGLLFACLIAALFVAEGAFHSIRQFNAQGFGSRYLVQAQAFPAGDSAQNKDVHARAMVIYKQRVADKQAAAKKLGITYDATTDQLPVTEPGGQGTGAFLDISSPAGQQAAAEYMQTHPLPDMADLKRVAASYHPKEFFATSRLSSGASNLTTMKDGKEDFSPTKPDIAMQYQNDMLLKYSLEKAPTSMTKPFLLPAAASDNSDSSDKGAGNADAIPIIVSYSAAEQILGMQALPKSASAAEQLDRIRTLYRTAQSGTLSACYRNSVSSEQIQQAISTLVEITANKSNKDYKKPELIYGLPKADSCGPATIVSDTRTKDTKTQADKQKQFDAMFGKIVDPDQQKISFRIVGLTPDAQDGAPSISVGGILQGLVQSSLSGTIVVPQELYETLPSVARYEAILKPQFMDTIYVSATTNYVEFSNATDARNFINDRSCNPGNGSCKDANTPFTLSAYGSNSIALRDMEQKFATFFRLAALAVVVVAAIIMTGTVGRMIADSRRETAVFRAVGAGRLDIASVYTLYAILLSLCIAGFALVVGVLAAKIVDQRYWQEATVQAQLAFGGSDLSTQFHLFRSNAKVLWVVLAALGAGLISILLPLVRNIRRSPIKDMRDE